MDNSIKKKARKFQNDFGLQKVSLDNLRSAIQRQGYTIVEYNNIFNDENVAALLDALNLEDYFRDAYYDCQYDTEEGTLSQQAVLYVSGANSYGASVSSYWLYAYDSEDDDWTLWGTCSSLNLDSDDDDYLVSLFAKLIVERDEVMKLNKSQIKNINTMFENDLLDQVELLDVDALDTSVIREQ